MKKVALALVILLLSAAPALADCAKCSNCMMKIPEDSKYMVTLSMKDGNIKTMCSFYCATMVRERKVSDVAGMDVLDYSTGEKLKAEDAVWVEGADIKSVMSDVPRIAFKDKASADAFIKVKGGKIVPYKDVYDNSVKEWKQ